MTTDTVTTEAVDLDSYRAGVVSWLEENAPDAEALRDVHDVSVFHNLDRETETAVLQRLRDWQRRKFEAGFGAITWPTQMHGAGLSQEHADVFKSEESRRVALTRHELFSVTTNLIAPTVRLYASDELRELLLPGLLDGSLLACQLFSEPGAGSDLANIATKGHREGDAWVITGQKVWTSGAQFADWGQAIVRTEAGSSRNRGLTTFMVPMGAAGVEIRQIRQMSGGTSFNEVFLTEVRIPDAYRLGEVGDGWGVTRATLGFERANASNKIGVGGSFDQLLELAGRTGGLSRPDVREQLAEIRLREVAAEVALHREKRDRDNGQPPGASGSLRKLQWVARLQMVTDLSRTLLGERLAWNHDEPGTFSWNAHVLGAPGYRIAGGADQVQRNIVAERHLGLPLEPRPARPAEQAATPKENR